MSRTFSKVSIFHIQKQKELSEVLDSGAGRRVLQDNHEILDASLLSSADLVVEQPVTFTVVDTKGNRFEVKAAEL